MKSLICALLGASLVCAASAASAVTFVYNQTFDRSVMGGGLDGPVTGPVLQAGDSVDMTIDFTGDQGLRYTAAPNLLVDFWFLPGQTPPSLFTISNIELTLIGFSTNAASVDNEFTIASQTDGTGQLGPRFGTANFGLASGEYVQFSGLNLTYDIDLWFESANPTQQVQKAPTALWLALRSGTSENVTIEVAAVPLPAALPLLAFALMGLGVTKRKRSA